MTSGSDAYRLLIQPQQDLGTAGYPPYSRNLSYVPSGSPEVTKKLLSDISEIHSVSLKHQAEAFYAYLSAGIHEHGLLSTLPVFYTVMEEDEFYLEWISTVVASGSTSTRMNAIQRGLWSWNRSMEPPDSIPDSTEIIAKQSSMHSSSSNRSDGNDHKDIAM